MLLTRLNLIYLHAPKTGGNSIQSLLLPYCDDEIVIKGHQDGVDRFQIKGEVTPDKHAVYSDYERHLGSKAAQFRVAISIRHPVDRAVSYYFSPHAWMRRHDDGEWRLDEPFWSMERFREQLAEVRPMSDFLASATGYRKPDLTIRYETIAEDMTRLWQTLGLPAGQCSLPHRNRSATSDAMKRKVLEDTDVRDLVTERFAVDMAMFGY